MADGHIIYRGPSMLNGKPIVVVATGFNNKSDNEKTGDMVQTWILADDMSPLNAIHSGADDTICGACPHRGTVENGKNVGRSCYVLVAFAPQNVWRTTQKGKYSVATDLAELGSGRNIRLGAYGDPAAVPMHIWQAFMSRAKAGTGYTHQWRKFPELAAYCMASCDSAAEREQAKALGFRTFRVRDMSEPILTREVTCPASKEAGYKTNCAACRACGGLSAKARADIVIAVHGAANKVQAFTAARAA